MITRLEDLSHSVRGIGLVCGLILLFGASLAGLLSLHLSSRPLPEAEPDLIQDLYARFLMVDFPEITLQSVFPDQVPEPLRFVFRGPADQWLSELTRLASTESPPQGARFALGLWLRRQGDLQAALDLFHSENGEFPDPFVRAYELDTALSYGDTGVVDRLLADPEYQQEVSSSFHVQRGLDQGNWNEVLQHYVRSEYESLDPLSLGLALVAGAVWAALLLSLSPSPPGGKLLLSCLAALALGWISTWPTVLSAMWMDRTFQISEGSDFFSTLFYMIVSVGVREEICKLLLFSPLLFITLRSGRDFDALLLGALVGLGFAVEENIRYFWTGGEGVAVSRFVSANLLHFTLTGAAALGLHRAVRDPGRWGIDAVQVLVFAIGLHGLYNTLLSQPVPGLGDMSYFSGTALAGCAFLFFREVEGLAPLRGRRLTRTALFCWGFCLLFCLELGLAVTRISFSDALYWTGQAALAGVFTGYIFVHFIRENLSP